MRKLARSKFLPYLYTIKQQQINHTKKVVNMKNLSNKETRLQIRQTEISRLIEKGASVTEYKCFTYAVWADDERDTCYLKAWKGTASKYYHNFYYTKAAERGMNRMFATVKALRDTADRWEAYELEKKGKKANGEEITDDKGFKIADTRKTTSLLKKYLQEKFGVKFSVRTEKYSGGSSMNVSYTGGPSKDKVEAIVNRLQYGNFNGMEDIYEYKDDSQTGLIIDGYKLETFKYNFVRREMPDSISFQMAKAVESIAKFPFPELTDMAAFRANFSERWGSAWNWSDFIYQNGEQKTNFVTNDLENVKILKAERTGDGGAFLTFVWTYEYNGKTYRTDEQHEETPTVELTKTIQKNGVRMVDYSKNAVAVIGNTYEIKDELKAIGGKFNRFLKIDGETVAGWIFSKNKESEISDLLIEYAATI